MILMGPFQVGIHSLILWHGISGHGKVYCRMAWYVGPWCCTSGHFEGSESYFEVLQPYFERARSHFEYS